ncbi:hypothetical protein EDB87DRAFT_446615 [Lactarius vividus]|nr:hypothetical protein EDB87DRAFT_446615 [Lactarius vividus]
MPSAYTPRLCCLAHILAFAPSKPWCTAPRRTPAGVENEVLSFALLTTLGISGTALVEDRYSVVGARLSQPLSGVSAQPPTSFSVSLRSSHVDGQQEEATHGGRYQSRSVRTQTHDLRWLILHSLVSALDSLGAGFPPQVQLRQYLQSPAI